MTTIQIIAMALLALFSIISIISLIYKAQKEAKNDLLNEMFQQDDIDVKTYRKYKQ